jgi:hypothetical protein
VGSSHKYSESTVCAVTRKDVEDADKCDCPTERRAALIAQLTQEDREALETDAGVQFLTTNTHVDLLVGRGVAMRKLPRTAS